MPQTARRARTLDLSINYDLHPLQRKIVQHPARFKVAACGRRFGKSEAGVSVGLFGDGGRNAGALKGAKVWWVAPDYGRASVGWNLVKRFLQDIPPEIMSKNETEKKVEFITGGFFQVKSGYDPDSLRGEGLDYVILDEIAFAKEEAWVEGIRPALADREGGALFISTPKGFNFFYDMFEKGLREDDNEWASFQYTSYDNPHVADSEIDAARVDYENAGQMHIFRQEFLAEFLEGAGLPIFPREWWTGQNRYDQTDQRLLRSGVGWWISVDSANKDKDENAYTAIVVGQFDPYYNLHIREVIRGRWQFHDLVNKVVSTAIKYRAVDAYDNKLRNIVIEDAASGIALNQVLKSSDSPWLRDLVVPIPPTRWDKEVKWSEAAAWCSRGFVKLPYPDPINAHWLMPFEQELFNVPGAKFFDQADAFAIMVNFLRLLFAGAYRKRRMTG